MIKLNNAIILSLICVHALSAERRLDLTNKQKLLEQIYQGVTLSSSEKEKVLQICAENIKTAQVNIDNSRPHLGRIALGSIATFFGACILGKPLSVLVNTRNKQPIRAQNDDYTVPAVLTCCTIASATTMYLGLKHIYAGFNRSDLRRKLDHALAIRTIIEQIKV